MHPIIVGTNFVIRVFNQINAIHVTKLMMVKYTGKKYEI